MSNTERGTIDPAKLEVHPIAAMFPLMEGQEFEELVADIRANGLRNPILLDRQGRILDGRNRLRACLAAGVEPRFETWNGEGSELELIVSLNLRRRHLNESQRAMLAARLKDKLAEENRNRLIPKGISTANLQSGDSAERAAVLLNVSPRSVAHAAKLLKLADSDLVVLVDAGKLSVSAAVEQAGESDTNGKFTVLYVEPTWERGKPHRAQIRSVAAADAVLFLWTPNARLAQSLRLLERSGFRYEASMAWRAEEAPDSRYVCERHDLLLIGARGQAPEPSVAPAAGKGGSRRDEVFAMIEHMFPDALKADLSATESPRPGWSAPLAPSGPLPADSEA